MARKRIKRSDILEFIDPHPKPFVAQLSDDGPLHIIIEKANIPYANKSRKFVELTKCKRVTEWPQRRTNLTHYDLCKRCGTLADFEHYVEEMERYKAEWVVEVERQRAMDDAIRIANNSWDWLGERIEKMIMDDLEEIVANKQVLIPLDNSEIEVLRNSLITLLDKPEFAIDPDFDIQHPFTQLLDKLEI